MLIIMPFILLAWGGLIYCIIKFRASRGHKPARSPTIIRSNSPGPRCRSWP